MKPAIFKIVLTLTMFLSATTHASTDVDYNREFPHLRTNSTEAEQLTDEQKTAAKEKIKESRTKIKEHIIKRYHLVCLGREATREEVETMMQKPAQELFALRKSEECNSEDANNRRAEYRKKYNPSQGTTNETLDSARSTSISK